MSISATERWKPIKGWEDSYEVSSLGRVQSKERKVPYKGKFQRTIRPRILQARKTKEGYWQVCLQGNGRKEWVYVHRLVAEAFCHRPEGCDIVNHLDSDPDNCRADNLEWTTQLGNIRHAIQQGRRIGKSVENSAGAHYELICMTAEDGFDPTCVSRTINGRQKTHKGLKWRLTSSIGDGIHDDLPLSGSRFEQEFCWDDE